MTDIVERLRQVQGDNEDAYEAAAEIERLRAQAVTDWIKHGDEIERLRAALAGIIEATDLDDVGVIARRALEPDADSELLP